MKILIAYFFSTLIALAAQAEVTVTGTVDRNGLNPDDTLTLTVSVDATEEVSVGQPTLPPMTEFDLLNDWTSQSQQGSMVYTNRGPVFKRTFTVRHNYLLQPKKQGNLNIGVVEVVVDGRAYRTKPIAVKVAPGAGVPQQQQPPNARGGRRGQPDPNMGGGAFPPPGMFDEEDEDLFSQLLKRGGPPPPTGSRTLPINPNDAFFVQVDSDKTEAYAGEQITVSFYLYTRGLIRDLDTLKYPSLRGFWKEDIEIASHLNFESEIVNGIGYKKALLASFALFPIKEGSATIDPYQAKCTVMSPLDSFGGFGLGKAYTYTKASMPVKVTVKPLPVENRPTDFSGAVGDFQVTSRVEDKNIIEGQPFTLKIRFEGRGNAKLIDLPPLTLPEGIEQYDVQNEARFFRNGNSFKEFRVMLMPRRQGDFVLPGISTSLFDPKTKAFVKRNTEAIPIKVGANSGAKMPGVTLGDSKGASPKAPEEPQLLLEYRTSATLGDKTQATLWVAIFAGISAVLMWRARSELGWGQRKKDLLRSLDVRMRKIHQLVDKKDYRSVGTAMTNALYFVLGEISGQGGANLELDKMLLKAPPSVRRDLAGPIKKLMETFEVLTFAPEAMMNTAIQDPAKIHAAVGEMEKLMAKAVSLGLSAERDGVSESGPRAS